MKEFQFTKARPVWAEGKTNTMNLEMCFKATIPRGSVILYIATAYTYRLFVNEEFIAIGPARAGQGFYRVDAIDLTYSLQKSENAIRLEAVAYNINSYEYIHQEPFITAELHTKNGVSLATGFNFDGYIVMNRIQKVQRYSFQRPFAEAYNIRQNHTDVACKLTVVPQKQYVQRQVPYPIYERLSARLIETGNVSFHTAPPSYIRDRSLTQIGKTLLGFPQEDLSEHLTDEAQRFSFLSSESPSPNDFYELYEFPFNATGLIHFDITCTQDATVYLLFDEILTNGKVDFLRLQCCNCFKYYVSKGSHHITTFEPYTMKYLQIVVIGDGRIKKPSIIEYKHPPITLTMPAMNNAKLDLIYQAAIETYRANAVDVFTDCPSRERAGWLCDSFFTARVETLLTGGNTIERAFLENYIYAQSYPGLPNGVLPMCYPADHPDGNFIPNWGMWFVLELEDYVHRTGDTTLVDRARPKITALLSYLEKFENQNGLLENLEQWVFIEWSEANEYTLGVNFPSNMLYARMLMAVAKLYSNARYAQKAKKLHQTIRERAFKGSFFTDQECLVENEYRNSGRMTEVCQYYAFFCGTATPATYPRLWQTLTEAFGPQRKKTGLYPQVAMANAFIGNYLRLELLYANGNTQSVLNNIEGYFYSMAQQTGTLWENDTPSASCNHGFASYVLYWLHGICSNIQ